MIYYMRSPAGPNAFMPVDIRKLEKCLYYGEDVGRYRNPYNRGAPMGPLAFDDSTDPPVLKVENPLFMSWMMILRNPAGDGKVPKWVTSRSTPNRSPHPMPLGLPAFFIDDTGCLRDSEFNLIWKGPNQP